MKYQPRGNALSHYWDRRTRLSTLKEAIVLCSCLRKCGVARYQQPRCGSPLPAACILARFQCMCKVRCGVPQHVTRMNLCVDVTAMSQIPAFVSRCHSTCMLPSVFCPAPSPCFIPFHFSRLRDNSSSHQSVAAVRSCCSWCMECSSVGLHLELLCRGISLPLTAWKHQLHI